MLAKETKLKRLRQQKVLVKENWQSSLTDNFENGDDDVMELAKQLSLQESYNHQGKFRELDLI